VLLRVEYAKRRNKYGIRFILSLFYEYIHLEYVHVHVIYRVDQAEYVSHILMAVLQEYVNAYPTCRVVLLRTSSGHIATTRRIYRRDFRDLDCCLISALGYAQIWGEG